MTTANIKKIADALSALRDDLPEDITLLDVQNNHDLGRLLLAADQLSNRMRSDALDYVCRKL